MILAPLRGVTIRAFREVFADILAESGFTEAITPFIAANPGVDPLKDREIRGTVKGTMRLTPQFIGKDPAALEYSLKRIKDSGFDTADLNCGCPYPMVRNKGRGSGILKTPDVLRRMLETGCRVMGEGKFSIKARLGVERPDELLALMPLINAFPLRFLTVHGRTARQMYDGTVTNTEVRRVIDAARIPVVLNGDIPFPIEDAELKARSESLMIGRAFVRYLGARSDSRELLKRYLDHSVSELHGDNPVLGRIKELLTYWKDLPHWRRRWPILKLSRSVSELLRGL